MNVGLENEKEDEAKHTEESIENEQNKQSSGQDQIPFDAEELSNIIIERQDEDHRDFLSQCTAGIDDMIRFEDETENLHHEPTESVINVHIQKNVKSSTRWVTAGENHF